MSKTLPKGVYTTEPKYLRPLEAAQRISVTREKIYQLVKSGSLKSYTVGACRLIKVSDLDQLVEGNA
jgi:excisionase family DNA binding protein